MRIFYKIQYYVVISVFFHLLLLMTLSSLAKLNKNNEELEIFIIEHMAKPLKKPSKALTTSTEKIIEQIPSNVETDKSITIEDKTESIINYSYFEASQKISSDEIKSNLKSDKDEIIDAEFGTNYGPRFIHREIPVYPQIARRLGKEGKVTLRLTFNEKGEVVHIEIVEGAPYGFTESAIEAVKKSKFAPAIKDGKPVACRAILPIRFVLKN